MRKIKFSTPNSAGLHEVINEHNSGLKVLNLSVLNLIGKESENIGSGECEVCYTTVIGAVQAKIGEKVYNLTVGDCLYVPRHKMTIIEGTGAEARVAICKAKVEEDTEIIYTRFGDAWQAELGHEVHGKYNINNFIFGQSNSNGLFT
jgi:5-deoxy-D-glucuronate isomerase